MSVGGNDPFKPCSSPPLEFVGGNKSPPTVRRDGAGVVTVPVVAPDPTMFQLRRGTELDGTTSHGIDINNFGSSQYGIAVGTGTTTVDLIKVVFPLVRFSPTHFPPQITKSRRLDEIFVISPPIPESRKVCVFC